MKPIEVMIVLEIVFVNVITISKCCEKKYKWYINLLTLLLFSSVVFGLGFYCISRFSFYGNGNGLFVVFGFLYLIPLGFLYKERVYQLFTIICMAWVYTLGIFSLSVQAGKVLDTQYFYRNVFLIETALFAICTIPFHRIIVKKYIYILENSNLQKNNWGTFLSLTSTIHFFTMLGVNFVFAMEDGSWIKVLVIALLMLTMFFMYNILYQMIRHAKQAYVLDRTAHHDELTGLRNRLSLFDDLQRVIDSNEIFTLLFMDLDKFKNINDTYGHVIGDQYLQHFANISCRIIGEKGCVYRFGGDEFLVIYNGIIPKETVKKLECCKEWDVDAPCPFNHVSIGVQICKPPHSDTEQLLEWADQCMYEKKKNKQ